MNGTKSRDDPFNLQRFLNAQYPVYTEVCSELRAGYKRGHWMWFIFPQILELGWSSMSRSYAITSLDEAKAYLDHPVLGARLIHCTELVCAVEGRSIDQIFGYPDDLKFGSSMTLFAHAARQNEVFLAALAKYFAGNFDPLTVRRL